MIISIIVAASANNVIGRDNQLPWHIPEDLAHFRKITMGKPILMGRKTHESIGKALPGRHNLILTRRDGYSAAGCTVVSGADDAIRAAGDADELIVIGGSEVYALMLPLTTRIYLTRIHANISGDTFFPRLDSDRWHIGSREDVTAEKGDAVKLSFLRLELKPTSLV